MGREELCGDSVRFLLLIFFNITTSLIMFKECLKYNFVLFMIEDNLKLSH